MTKCIVKLTKLSERGLKKVPSYIADKFQLWLDLVEEDGIKVARLIKGFHDEPLKRKGQRSIRLSKAYRAQFT